MQTVVFHAFGRQKRIYVGLEIKSASKPNIEYLLGGKALSCDFECLKDGGLHSVWYINLLPSV
jgi:hypothetical protein